MPTPSEILKAQEAKVSSLERELAMEKVRLEGMRLMAEQMAESDMPTPNVNDKPKRRMRLGSKKRVVYQLVAQGFETIETLTRQLGGSVIDARYIRDVVRDAINDDDMHGNLDDKFILSDFGKELLENAPFPKDWSDFESLTAVAPITRTAQNNTPAASLPTGVNVSAGEVTASPDTRSAADELLEFLSISSGSNHGSS